MENSSKEQSTVGERLENVGLSSSITGSTSGGTSALQKLPKQNTSPSFVRTADEFRPQAILVTNKWFKAGRIRGFWINVSFPHPFHQQNQNQIDFFSRGVWILPIVQIHHFQQLILCRRTSKTTCGSNHTRYL